MLVHTLIYLYYLPLHGVVDMICPSLIEGCLDACVGTWGRVESSDCVTSFVRDSDFVCDYFSI